MLQRFQTVFLAVVVLSMVATLFFPIWTKADNEAERMMKLTAFSLKTYEGQAESSSKSTFYIAVLALAAAAVAGYSITQYQKRITQIKLGALSSFLMAALLLTCLYLSNQAEKELNPTEQGNYVIGFFLPVVGLVGNLLANRFIRRDEMLVRSADRLR
jgi:uncharacterized membrane protein